MKLTQRLLIGSLITAIALPVAAFAAKGERKKDKNKSAAVAFSTVDKDSDGNVTKDEYVAAMKERLGEDSAKSQFASLDKDSNGKLSKEEFEASGSKGKKERKKKNQE